MEKEFLPLNFKPKTGEIYQYISSVEYSTGTKLYLNIKKNEEGLKALQVGTRFIVGDIFPRAYILEEINEYPTNDDTITKDVFDRRGSIIIKLKLDLILNTDDLKGKIADNTRGTKIG